MVATPTKHIVHVYWMSYLSLETCLKIGMRPMTTWFCTQTSWSTNMHERIEATMCVKLRTQLWLETQIAAILNSGRIVRVRSNKQKCKVFLNWERCYQFRMNLPPFVVP